MGGGPTLTLVAPVSQVRAGGNGSRQISSGQTVATGRGLHIRRVRSEYSFPFVFSESPRVILSAPPLEQNRILGYTDLGEVAEAAPPTSDGSESNLSSASPVSC